MYMCVDAAGADERIITEINITGCQLIRPFDGGPNT